MRRMMPDQVPVNYISVASVEDFTHKAEQLGAKVVVPKMPVPNMGWFAHLSDPEGNVFAIWEHDPHAGQTAGTVSREAGNVGK
jgi:predicted enzyme related to lactoylglutathione lyase